MFEEDLAVLPLEGVLLFADGVKEDMDGVALRAIVIGLLLFFWLTVSLLEHVRNYFNRKVIEYSTYMLFTH